jgi:hypothetical protein
LKNINLKNKFFKKNQMVLKKKSTIYYNFFFISLFSPLKLKNIKTILNFNFLNKKKILIKQSYLILIWIFYLLKFNKNKNIKIPKIHVKPLKKLKFTIIKSPMAHKTFSQEQYLIKFYKLTIVFKIFNEVYLNFSNSLILILIFKKYINLIESNFFFLKKLKINLINN